MAEKKKKKGITKKLILLAFSLGLAFVVLEGAARLFLGGGYPMSGTDLETARMRFLCEHFSAHMLQRSDQKAVCYELKPKGRAVLLGDGYTVNDHGFRGPGIQEEKPEGTRRIVLAGDSFVFGWGDDDAWTISAIMERILTRVGRDSERFQVINSGVPGYNVAQMKEYLLRKTLTFDPDVLVLVVSANDIVADYLHFNTLFQGLYADFLPLPYSWKPWLWRLSVAYRFVVQRYKGSLEQAGQVGGFTERDLAFFETEVKAIEALARERGMGFLCVLLPMLEPFDAYPYAQQHQDMHRVLEGIDLVDLLPRMKHHDVRELWFRVEDHHLNDRANLGVARMILSSLEQRNLVQLEEGALPADPLGPLFDPHQLVVADADADPLGRGGFPGALLRVDPLTGEVGLVSADPLFREPVDLVFEPDGNLLVLDSEADPDGLGSHGALFRVDRYTGRARPVLTSKHFVLPNALLLDDDGRIYLSEKNYNPEGLEANKGAVMVFDPELGSLEVLASGADFVAPGPLAFAPDNKLYLIDADANPEGHLDPHGHPATPGVLFEVDRITGETQELIAFKDTVSPVGIVPLEDGRLIVIDANADPLGLGYDYFMGGLVMVDPIQRTYELFFGSPQFLDPTRGDLGFDGQLYIADANADPHRLGPDGTQKGVTGQGHGAIWRFDLQENRLSLVVSSRRFMTPMCLKSVPVSFSD